MKIKKFVETKLPTMFGEFTVVAYDSGYDDFPHLALIANDSDSEIKNVRIHSECMTGDVFSSTKCDCGEQLHYSMKYAQENGGVVLYLRQEGRGIGLISKLQAYNLQNEGMDTIEANEALGFHADLRNYDMAIGILNDLGISKINLMTNNPEKINAFNDSGISVESRIPIEIEPRKENESYLKTKKFDMGHLISKVQS